MKGDNSEWENVKKLNESIQKLTCAVWKVIVSQIIAEVVIFVGTFLLRKFLPTLEPSVLVALIALAAVQITSGCLLYGFIANLQYKALAANQEIILRYTEIAAKDCKGSSSSHSHCGP